MKKNIIYLSKIVNKVYMFVRSDKLKASHINQKKLKNSKNIELIFDSQIKEINGDGCKINSVEVFNTKNNLQKNYEVNAIFLAIGSTPNSKIFENQLELDQNGFIKLFNHQETSKRGIFSAGDISDPIFKQAITAAGDSTKAALQAIDFLHEIGYTPENKIITKHINIQNDKPQKSSKAEIIDIDYQEQLQKIIAKNNIVVVDFYGSFCIPCQQMIPIFSEIAEKFTDKAIFVKVNVERLANIAKKHSITSIPSFLIYKNGKIVKTIVGLKSKNDFEKELQAILNSTD